MQTISDRWGMPWQVKWLEKKECRRPSIKSTASGTLFFQESQLVLKSQRWPELIPVNQHAFVAVLAQLARDHLDRLANIHLAIINICQLGGHHGALHQLDNRYGVGGVAFVAFR